MDTPKIGRETKNILVSRSHPLRSVESRTKYEEDQEDAKHHPIQGIHGGTDISECANQVSDFLQHHFANTYLRLLAKKRRSLYTFITAVLISARVMSPLSSLSNTLKASLASSAVGYAMGSCLNQHALRRRGQLTPQTHQDRSQTG